MHPDLFVYCIPNNGHLLAPCSVEFQFDAHSGELEFARTPPRMNKLYFGDNLHILREHIKDETVDLIYLDPPFNSKRDRG